MSSFRYWGVEIWFVSLISSVAILIGLFTLDFLFFLRLICGALVSCVTNSSLVNHPSKQKHTKTHTVSSKIASIRSPSTLHLVHETSSRSC